MCGVGQIWAARVLTVTLETGPCAEPEEKSLRFFPQRGHSGGEGGSVCGNSAGLFGELAMSIHKPSTSHR